MRNGENDNPFAEPLIDQRVRKPTRRERTNCGGMLAADVRENAHQRDEALHLVQKITTQTDRCGL